MNTRSFSALFIAAGTLLTCMTAQASSIPTLDTLQVRPSIEQVAQQDYERNSAIPTLEAVQVCPSAEQLAEAQAQRRIVDLATVEVRPSADQMSERLTPHSDDSAYSAQASAAISALIGQVIVHLPIPQLHPSPDELEAVIGQLAKAAVRY